jgi:hypothetical protein
MIVRERGGAGEGGQCNVIGWMRLKERGEATLSLDTLDWCEGACLLPCTQFAVCFLSAGLRVSRKQCGFDFRKLTSRWFTGSDAFLLEALFRNNVWEFMLLPVSEENERAVCLSMIDGCK